MPIEQTFSVGDWEVHPRQHRISRGNETVALEPKVMQLLLRLAESPGKVVLRRELLEDVWKGTIVTEEALFRAVSSLRKALGDSPRSPTFLETIPKAGYRLMAPVDFKFAHGDSLPTLRAKLPEATTGPASLATVSRDRRWNHPAFLAGAFVAVIAMAYLMVTGGLMGSGGHQEARPLLASAAVTTFFGFEIQPALSPDGQNVAFIWSGPDNGSINVYVQSLEAETPMQLTDDFFYEYSPSWSPEGSRLAFARSREGIFVRPVIGGSERRVAEIGPSARPSLDWSPAGEELVVSDTDSSGSTYRLYLVDLETGTRTTISEPPAHSIGDRDPAFSPDGRQIAFIRSLDASDELHVIGASGSASYAKVSDGYRLEGVDWSPDGESLMFSSDRGGTFELWQVNSGAAGEPTKVLGGPDALRDPSIAESRVVYTRSQRDVNLWSIDPVGGAPALIPGSSGYDGDPAAAYDGNRVAFVSDRSGATAIYVLPEGAPPTRITSTVGAPENPVWSPGDQWIAFDALSDGNRDIYLVAPDGGPVRRLTDHAASDAMPSFSPDGEWLYYASRRDGSWGIRRVSTGGERASESVIEETAFRPQLASDGTLLFSRPGRAGIWTLAGGAVSEVLSIPNEFEPSGWTVDASTIWAVDRSDRNAPLLGSFDLTGRQLGGSVPLPSGVRGVVVQDGRILVERLDHALFDIMLAIR